MGWTVLYIAFGVVALWLLGEVLLQYKARLRWRLLAFVGFLGVVLGVLIPSVPVIGLGAAAFAVGQTYVTLSFRSGFSAGWAVAGRPGFLARFGKGKDRDEGEYKDPSLEVSDLEASEGAYAPGNGADADFPSTSADGFGNDAYDTGAGTYRQAEEFDRDYDRDRDDVFTPARSGRPMAADSTAVYEPQPLPDDTGSYGIYSDAAYAAAAGQDQSYAGAGQDQSYATAAQGTDQQNYGYDGYTGYDQQQYGYDASGQQQYAAYSDPYIGQGYGGNSYDAGYDQQQYGQQGYTQDQYGNGGYGETPGNGVWVPQQRNTDDPFGGELPPEQQYYQDNGDGQGNGNGQTHGNGYDEQQYRF